MFSANPRICGTQSVLKSHIIANTLVHIPVCNVKKDKKQMNKLMKQRSSYATDIMYSRLIQWLNDSSLIGFSYKFIMNSIHYWVIYFHYLNSIHALWQPLSLLYNDIVRPVWYDRESDSYLSGETNITTDIYYWPSEAFRGVSSEWYITAWNTIFNPYTSKADKYITCVGFREICTSVPYLPQR